MRGFLFLVVLSVQINWVAHGQLLELEVQSVNASENSIPVFREYPEHAAVIINSSITSLQFDSNVEIVADLSDPGLGVYRLIIPPFRQSISVNVAGYKQLRFTVPVSNLRQVLFYEIDPLESSENLIPIFMVLNQLDANVTIDNKSVNPNAAIRLSIGSHSVRLEKEGYRTIEEEIEVSEDNVRFDYELDAIQPTTVTYTSNPPEARIEINNIEIGETDRQEFRFPGTYFIRVSKPGYRSVQQNITIVENLSNDPSLNKFHFRLDQSLGELNLSVNPPNSTIFLNRESYGSQSTIKVTPGTYLLEVEKSGYTGYSEPISIIEGDILTRSITLEQIVGSLRLTVRPINTRMRLINSDNELFREWEGAVILENVPIGEYRLLGAAENYENYAEQITIERDQTFVSDIQMPEYVSNQPLPEAITDTLTKAEQVFDNPISNVDQSLDNPETFIQGFLGPSGDEMEEPLSFPSSKDTSIPVALRVFPGMASIYIDNNPLRLQGVFPDERKEQQTQIVRLVPGIYTIRIELEGYMPVSEQIRVTLENREFYFSMDSE